MLFYGLTDWQFWIYGLYFVLLAVGLFWLPGYFLLRKEEKFTRASKFFLSPILGMVLLTALAYTGGVCGSYWLLYVYVGVIIVAAAVFLKKEGKKENLKKLKEWGQKLWTRQGVLLSLILLGLVIQLPAIFGSGLRGEDGGRFFFTNNQDGLMHLGFINSLAQSWPALRPEVNDLLQNYHYFSDLLMAQLVRLGLPTAQVFFQFMPVLISILTTGIIYQAILLITKRKKIALITTLVCLLAGDGGYLLSQFISGGKGWEMATFDNGADQFLNMPFAMAKMIFFAAFMNLNFYWQEKKNSSLFLLLLLLIPLTLFKVYWLFFFLGGWGVTLLVRTIKILITDDKTWKQCWGIWQKLLAKETSVYLIVLLGGFVLLKSITSMSDSLVWVPLVWPREIAAAQQLNWREWFLCEQQFVLNHNQKRIIWENGKLIGVALIFVYGARLFGLLINQKVARSLRSENVWFLLTSFFVWTFFGFNFLQEKGGYNTFNFLILAATCLSILLGVNLAIWWGEKIEKRQKWGQKALNLAGKFIVIMVFALLLPRTYYNWQHYLQITKEKKETAGFYENSFLELLEKAQQKTKETELIVVSPENERQRRASVVPGLIGRKTYLSNQFILATHNYDYAQKEETLKSIFAQTKLDDFKLGLRNLGIKTVILEWSDVKKMNLNLQNDLNKNLDHYFYNQIGILIEL